MTCPLCYSSQNELFDQDKLRHYYLCQNCGLVFVPRNELISESSEKSRYDAHENAENNRGYRAYLTQIANSIRPHLKSGDHGLDFGCGRTKLLAEILTPHDIDSYDVYFHPDELLIQKKYDFIILSEVIEHLRDPAETMKKLRSLSSTFFIKTKMCPDKDKFSEWFYKRDHTHVQFFNDKSFDALGFKSWKKIGDDLYLFTE
jgi:transcription initiation factor TFIIIB Brf1 subunit/transcription initiation factor TFIIB